MFIIQFVGRLGGSRAVMEVAALFIVQLFTSSPPCFVGRISTAHWAGEMRVAACPASLGIGEC